jgi:hypothetical protein
MITSSFVILSRNSGCAACDEIAKKAASIKEHRYFIIPPEIPI